MASETKLPSKIEDYHVLPIALPSLPSLPIEATHYMYLKPHTPDVLTAESQRSLFLVNIPVDTTDLHLKELFSTQIGLQAGRILDVQFEGSTRDKKSASSFPTAANAASSKSSRKRKREAAAAKEAEDINQRLEEGFPPVWDRHLHRSGSTAIVVFVDKTSMNVALKTVKAAIESSRKITWGEGLEDKLPPLGSQRYIKHLELSRPPKSEILAHVNDWMDAYNAKQEFEAKAKARKRQEPDEDGFVTVTRGGRNPAVKMETAQESLEKQREKQKGFGDFYRFQGRERRKEKAMELVKKFEEDKKKVQMMRMDRTRFLPE